MKPVMLATMLLLIFGGSLCAQDFYDINTVNEIRLYFTQANWDQLLDNLYAQGEDRLVGTAVINGVTYDSVGVRYKGNSSYSANRNKNPFNIKLDHIIPDQTIGPYGTLKLANGYFDPSFVRETLSYEIARKYMPASRANYATVYVNDQLIGAYSSVQDVDSHFMNQHFHCSGMPRFKSGTNSMNPITVWGYQGTNPTAYDAYYDLESNQGWDTLINFTYTLQNDYNNIAEVMNVDQNLWMCAFDNLLVNLDSPINLFHNFYLFSDADNRINPILWDLNMTFGGFPSGTVTQMQQLDPMRNATSNTFLLLKNIINVNPRYKKMYIAHMRTMITENFSNGWYATRASELQNICGPIVQNDANFFYTYANFLANLNNPVIGGGGGPGGSQTVPGITQLMGTRASYLLNNANFSGTVPTLNTHSHSPDEIVAGSSLQFNVSVNDANFVQMGFRQNHTRKFSYYQMYDDGAHNDGAAGDGNFGVSIPISTGDIEYFFWAENSSQGMFFPPRAEYEFFSLAGPVSTGEILINEIMAKNASFADPFGEFDDWVELYNPNDYPVNIGGMYMTDSHYSNGITAWTQIPANYPTLTTIAPQGYLVVWFDEDLDQGPLHINDKLGGGADSVYLISADGQTVIDSFTWTEATDLNVNDRSIGRYPNGSDTWVLFGAGQTNPVTQGSSNSLAPNASPIIENISYSPNPAPANTPIIVSAIVSDPDGSIANVSIRYVVVEEMLLMEMPMDYSDGHYSFNFGAMNHGTQRPFSILAVDNLGAITQSPTYSIQVGFVPASLYINEVMPSNSSTIADESGSFDDWVEIYNPNPYPVDIGGYYVTDNHYGDPSFTMHQISPHYPEISTIPAHGFILLWFDEQPEEGILHVNTKLGTASDAVYLLAPDMLSVIDMVAWNVDSGLAADLSWGRASDGGEPFILFGADADRPVSPGSTNGSVSNTDDNLPIAPLTLKTYPNPMHKELSIELQNSKGESRIRIYNVRGQLVKEYNSQNKVRWQALDNNGKALGSGIYFITAEADKRIITKKICLIR